MDNYEYVPPQQPARRTIILCLIGFILSALAIVALVYFLVWFIFFRNPDTAKTSNKGTATSQTQSGSNSSRDSDSGSTSNGTSSSGTSGTNATNNGTQSGGTSNSSSNSSGSASKNTNGSSTSKTPASGNLSNTGPGDVLAVFVATVIIATIVRRLQFRSA